MIEAIVTKLPIGLWVGQSEACPTAGKVIEAIMTKLSISGVDETVVSRLRAQAKSQGISLNAFLVELIQTSAGVRSKPGRHSEYRDLDHLAGTWTAEDAYDFEESQLSFEGVDKELWR
ncbi:MAG: hypothetical protein P8Y25_15835 [Chromatiaceae bacterium]